MMKTALAILFLSLTVSSVTADDRVDVLYLSEGTVLRGRIVEELPNGDLRFFLLDRSETIVPRDQIGRQTKIKLSKVPGNLKGVSYFDCGACIGTPAVYNLLAGYWFGDIGFRFSGIFTGSLWKEVANVPLTYGLLANIALKLSDTNLRRHMVSVFGGLTGFSGAFCRR